MARNIPLDDAGTVAVNGRGVPPGHQVWLAGTPVPVDGNGSFVAEALVPSGMHTVEVAVLDPEGNGALFLRDLELEKSDWFYVGFADITLSASKTRGSASALEGSDAPYDRDSWADGRLAFYLKGTFGDGFDRASSS